MQRCPRAPTMVVLAVAVVTLNVLTSRAESEVSPIDEREHIDHFIRASQGDFPQRGTVLTQETLRELCSRGSEYIAWPGCTPGRLDPSDYAVGGVNASSDDPFYHLITAPVARALRAVTPGAESLVTWGRVLGSVWLLAGFYLVLRVGDALVVPRFQLVLALVLVAALPIVLTATTTIAPDATTIVGGAAMLFAALSWERTGRHLWILGVVAAAAALFRTTNGVGALVVLTYLGFRALAAARGHAGTDAQPWQRYALACVVMLASMVVAVSVWDRVDDLRSPPPSRPLTQAERDSETRLNPLLDRELSEGVPAKEVIGGNALFRMFPPVQEVAGPTGRTTGPNAPWYQLFVVAGSLLMVGALLLTAFRVQWTNRLSTLGVATILAVIAASPLLVVFDYYVNSTNNVTVPRFGLSALPAMAVVVAAAARERLGGAILVIVAAGGYLSALLTLT